MKGILNATSKTMKIGGVISPFTYNGILIRKRGNNKKRDFCEL